MTSNIFLLLLLVLFGEEIAEPVKAAFPH